MRFLGAAALAVVVGTVACDDESRSRNVRKGEAGATGEVDGGGAGGTGGTGGAGGAVERDAGPGGAAGSAGAVSRDAGAPDAGACVACIPDFVDLSGSPPAAGVDFDHAARTCGAVSGFPAADQLVVDDLGGGQLTGSGSGYEVVSVTGASFTNGSGFYQLSGVMPGVEVALHLRRLSDNEEVIVHFRVDAGTPLTLAAPCVEFL